MEKEKQLFENYVSKKMKAKTKFTKYMTQYYYGTVGRGTHMLNLFHYFTDSSLDGKSVLDCGCGMGGLLVALSGEAKKATGIELDKDSVNIALNLIKNRNIKNISIYNKDIFELKKEKYDIIFCIDVLEHVKNQTKLIKQLYTLLNKDGIIFIKQGNKITPFEPHTCIPYISLLPSNMADKIILKKIPEFFNLYESYEEIKLLSFMQLKKLFEKNNIKNVKIYSSVTDYFPYLDYTAPHSPFQYKPKGTMKKLLSSKKNIGILSLPPFCYFAKDWFVVIRKE